jgi:AbrB family looped-hinge helix DNA binding protein
MLKKLINLKVIGTTTVWPKWQIVIPKEIRNTLDINPWDNLVVLMKDWKYIGLVKNDNIWDLMKYVTSEWAELPCK